MTTWHVVDCRCRHPDTAFEEDLPQCQQHCPIGVGAVSEGSAMKIAFAGPFAMRLAAAVQARLSLACEVIADDEAGIVSRLAGTKVLVSMGFTKRMAEAGPDLRLVQVPGAGLDRIERSALP